MFKNNRIFSLIKRFYMFYVIIYDINLNKKDLIYQF